LPDLDAVLTRLRTILRPDGALVLSELVRTSVFHTIVFGLFDAWWPEASDTRRQRHSPLLDSAAWRSSLAVAGFDRIRTTGIGPRGGRAVQAVVVAPNHPSVPMLSRSSSGGKMSITGQESNYSGTSEEIPRTVVGKE